MLAVIMSMKPEWWEKIQTGEKTLEIRKSAPKHENNPAIEWPMLVLVYVSGTGAVQGQFICQGWIKTNLLENLEKRSCVPLDELREYANRKSLYGWMISSVEKYETPEPLAEFGISRPPMSWQYIELPDFSEV